MTRRNSDPFALGKAVLAAQEKQLELARQMLNQGQAAARWQKEALDTGERLAKAQRDWLKLWGW
jgi:hypothetical protein